MSQKAQAVIIPFPTKPRGTATQHDRLSRALEGLAQALAAQQLAVAVWRERLAQLQVSVSGLDHHVHAYSGRLSTLRHDIGLLRRQAEQLGRMADQLSRN